MPTVLREITDPTGTERVLIVRRDDGRFGFEHERWSDEPSEMAWVVQGQRPFSICGSEEIALREAMGRVEWLRAVISPDEGLSG